MVMNTKGISASERGLLLASNAHRRVRARERKRRDEARRRESQIRPQSYSIICVAQNHTHILGKSQEFFELFQARSHDFVQERELSRLRQNRFRRLGIIYNADGCIFVVHAGLY